MSCSLATFLLALLQNTADGNFKANWAGATLKFGNNDHTVIEFNSLYLMPAAIILGFFGGLFGSLFLIINGCMNDIVRKKLLKKKWQKPVETFTLCFLTATVFYWFSMFSDCETYKLDPKLDISELKTIHSAWCEDPYSINDERSKKINTLATMFWNTEGGVMRVIVNQKISIPLKDLLIFAASWFTFTTITFGTYVPAGLLVPGMIIGACLGNILTIIATDLGVFTDPNELFVVRRKFIVMGMGGFMAGYTRMTYSLGVILMETTQDLTLFVPLIFVIMIAS